MRELKNKLPENVKRDIPIDLVGVRESRKFSSGKVQGPDDPARHWLRSLNEITRPWEIKDQSLIEQERAFARHQFNLGLRDVVLETAVAMEQARRRGTDSQKTYTRGAFEKALADFMVALEIE